MPSRGPQRPGPDDEDVTDADAPIIKLVSLIILEAFRNRASDIHLEPLGKKFRVRYRIDGVLHEVDSPPKRLQSAIISRVKIMANMSIAEKRVPQDGRIQINVMGRDLDLRVSTIPTNHGESIVMRILDKAEPDARAAQARVLLPTTSRRSRRLIGAAGRHPPGHRPHRVGQDHHAVRLPEPASTGRTARSSPSRTRWSTSCPASTRCRCRPDIGLTFAAALRSILRQAPNIIMIGEIRDMETAEIAIKASLTGHLVFSTLHTNDAPSAVTRLIDIGVKPFLVASSTRGDHGPAPGAQHLRELQGAEYSPPSAELRLLGPARRAGRRRPACTRGTGCPECSITGYRGRNGHLRDCSSINDEIRDMIFERRSATEPAHPGPRTGHADPARGRAAQGGRRDDHPGGSVPGNHGRR